MKKVIGIALTCLLCGCTVPKLFEEERRYFEANVQHNPEITYGEIQGVYFARSGDAEKPTLIFIHGTPGNWRFAARYMLDQELLSHANIVAIDRPGWGKSLLDPQGKTVLAFAGQAQRLRPLVAEFKRARPGQPLILVGHSLGASLSPQMALDYPELIDGIVLISGALDPHLGKPRWYNLAASMGVVSWVLGDEMRKANREIMPMHEDLGVLAKRWDQLDVPIMVIQGMRDQLVYPENAAYAERVFRKDRLTMIRLPEAGHLIPWQHRDQLTRYLIEFLRTYNSGDTEGISGE